MCESIIWISLESRKVRNIKENWENKSYCSILTWQELVDECPIMSSQPFHTDKSDTIFSHTYLWGKPHWSFMPCLWVQIILVEYKLFWTGPIHFGRVQIILEWFGQVQIVKSSPEKSNLNLTKMIWTQPKLFGPDQNNLDGSKSFWTYKRTKH